MYHVKGWWSERWGMWWYVYKMRWTIRGEWTGLGWRNEEASWFRASIEESILQTTGTIAVSIVSTRA